MYASFGVVIVLEDCPPLISPMMTDSNGNSCLANLGRLPNPERMTDPRPPGHRDP